MYQSVIYAVFARLLSLSFHPTSSHSYPSIYFDKQCYYILGPRENPHKEQLYKERVKEQKLRPLILLRPGIGLHRTASLARAFGEQHILEGAHLQSRLVNSRTCLFSAWHTKKNELAMKV